MAQTVIFPAPQNGIVRPAAVDESVAVPESVDLAVNLDFDRIGAATRRKGVERLGSQITAGESILGMGSYRNNLGTIYAPIVKIDSAVKAYQSGSWGNIRTGLNANTKARFAYLVDLAFMVDGSSSDGSAVQSWDGAGNFDTTNVASLPKGDFIETYRSRLWVADQRDDKVYHTDVVNTDGTISGGTDFIQVNPADGERITALKRHARALLVFKQNHIYRIFSVNSADPDPSINRGTYSQESVVEAKDGIYYHHPSGFYKFVFDGEQEEISRPIVDVVAAIPRSMYENIVGWADDDHVYWSVGDITLGDLTIKNCVVRRTISTKVWTLYSDVNRVTAATLYDDGSTGVFNLVGDTDGNVAKYGVGNLLLTSEIPYRLRTQRTYVTLEPDDIKDLPKAKLFHENGAGARLEYRTDEMRDASWEPCGGVTGRVVSTHTVDAKSFTRIQMQLIGSGSGEPEVFRQIVGIDLSASKATV